MSQQGRQIYGGPVSEALGYFQSLGYTCPSFENPADFYIDLLTLDSTSLAKEEESKRRINEIIEQSQSTRYEPEQFKPDESVDAKRPPMPGRIRQTALIAKRSIMNSQRSPAFLIGKGVQTLIMAFAIAILWWQIDNDQSAIQDRLGVVFIVLLGSAFPEAMGGLLVCE